MTRVNSEEDARCGRIAGRACARRLILEDPESAKPTIRPTFPADLERRYLRNYIITEKFLPNAEGSDSQSNTDLFKRSFNRIT